MWVFVMRLILYFFALFAVLTPDVLAHERWVEHQLLAPFREEVFRWNYPTTRILLFALGLFLFALPAAAKRFSGQPSWVKLLPGPQIVARSLAVSVAAFAVQGAF